MDDRSTTSTKTKKTQQPKKTKPTKIHYLKELKVNAKTSYTIKVKALRVWNTYYMEAPSKANEINANIWGEPVLNYNINMILMDEEGTKIHACANFYTIFKAASQKPLKEGAQLIISDFKCVPNQASIRLTEHDAKIYFKKQTCVTVTDDFESKSDGFEFVSFESIINNQISKDKAFDVLGQIVSNKKLKQVNVDQKPTSLIEYELQNTSGHKIQCVLWEDDADALQYYINKNITTTDPVVMILQLAKINIWENKQHVSSINKASKIYINDNNKHISLFKERLQNNISNGTCKEPHLNLKTTFNAKTQENVLTKSNKMTNTREIPKIHGYHAKDIITIEDSEDEKISEDDNHPLRKEKATSNKTKDDDVGSSKNFVLDDESDEHSASKVCATKKRHSSNIVDVEDLKPKTKKTKIDADIPQSKMENYWLNDWEFTDSDFQEYYEDDDCY